MRFHTLPHFARRLEDRGLSIERAKNTVSYGEKRRLRPGIHGGSVWVFTERNQLEKLVVVAEIRGRECWLITTYLEGL